MRGNICTPLLLGKLGMNIWITKKSVDIPYNTEIVFHFAGEQKEATIPVNEVEFIKLSS